MADAPERRPDVRRRRAWFVAGAALILVVAFVVRAVYVDSTPGMRLVGDARNYDGHAVSIAKGEGYADRLGTGRPTAFRPPGYTFLLGGLYHVTGVWDEPQPQRVVVARRMQVVIGTVLVAMLGLLATQLWGGGVALVAMGLAAIYVPLVTMSGTLMSEPLFVVFMLAALSAALQYRRSAHGYPWAMLAGLLAGAAILTRANGMIVLLPLFFAVWGKPRLSPRALGPPVALVAVAVLAVSPWTLRNWREFHMFIPVTTQLGSALAGTYNDEARTDPVHPGSWRSLRRVPSYADLYGPLRQTDEPVLERRLRRRAQRYALEHPVYVAQVAFWATVRGFELDGIDWAIHTASTVSIGATWAKRGVWCFWVFAVLAFAGAFTRLARIPPWFVWAFPALMYLSVVFLVIETPRYRTPLDPFIVLLAALALVTAGRRLARR